MDAGASGDAEHVTKAPTGDAGALSHHHFESIILLVKRPSAL